MFSVFYQKSFCPLQKNPASFWCLFAVWWRAGQQKGRGTCNALGVVQAFSPKNHSYFASRNAAVDYAAEIFAISTLTGFFGLTGVYVSKQLAPLTTVPGQAYCRIEYDPLQAEQPCVTGIACY